MKKSLFLIPCLAAALWSCSDKNVIDSPDNGGINDGTEPRYIAVSIIDNVGTRASYETDYENGTETENDVKSIRFYLFDKNSQFKTSTHTADLSDGTAPNIEKKIDAMIIFEEEGKNKIEGPIQIVAVINPPDDITTSPSSLEDLQDEIDNYLLTTKGSFVMSNSVYVNDPSGTPEEVIAYQAPQAYDNREDALKNAIDIYVERVVAKVSMSLKTGDGGLKAYTGSNNLENVYELDNQSDYQVPGNVAKSGASSTDNVDIYVKLLGWNVTGTASKSRLVKKVQTGWNLTTFDWGRNNDWTYPTYFRSFWAQNPDTYGTDYELQWGAFDTNPEGAIKITDFAGSTYLLENAAWDEDGKNPTYPTKLIVGAQLVNSEGTAIPLAQWKNSYYTIEGLKNVLAANCNLYTKTGNGGPEGYTYTLIESGSTLGIEYKTETELKAGYNFDPKVPDDGTRYFVYAQTNLQEEPTNIYEKSNTGEFSESPVTIERINKILKDLGKIKAWNSGHTYYYLDIEHLGAKSGDVKNEYGQYGIVRNHVYKFEINKIAGFGVPVYKDSETIYPEELNDPEYTFLGAKINILSWRIVNQGQTTLGK